MRHEVIILMAVAAFGCQTPGSADNGSLVKGLDGCGGGESDKPPTFVSAQVKIDLSSSANDDFMADRARMATKTPVVVYMAIDTGEPFMKLSVDHELRSLREACDGDTAVNWIAFVNSHLTLMKDGVPSPVVARCQKGEYKVEALPAAVTEALETRRDLYAAGKKCSEDEQICIRINQPFKKEKAAEFREFPLAHPDIIVDMLEYARTLYPADKFAYFVHLKSHGSENFLTTGLGPEQVQEKSECQKAVILKHYQDHPEAFVPASDAPDGVLGQVGLGQVGLGQVGLGQVGLGQVGLGQVGLGQVGLGQVGLGQVGLGQVGLGQVGLGKFGGLGLGFAGLGAQNHYGTRHTPAITAFRWFTTRGTGDEDLAFVFFESCESRASRILTSAANCSLPPLANPLTKAFINDVEKLHAYYSAAQSLWYRNIDWDQIYATWLAGDRKPASLQKKLIETVKLIPNYNFTAQDPLPPCD